MKIVAWMEGWVPKIFYPMKSAGAIINKEPIEDSAVPKMISHRPNFAGLKYISFSCI